MSGARPRGRNGVDTGPTKRVAARETNRGKPHSVARSVTTDRLRRILRAGRQESAGSSKERRKQHFVDADQRQREALGRIQFHEVTVLVRRPAARRQTPRKSSARLE